MKKIDTFLLQLRNDVFKVLPMKEAADKGKDNHLADYIHSLVISSEGATSTYSNLDEEKTYIYVINNLNYLHSNTNIEFATWRKIILNCTRNLTDLSKKYADNNSGGELKNE